MWATFTKKLTGFVAMLFGIAAGLLLLWTVARKSGKAEADTVNANIEVKRVRREAAQQIEVEREANERQIEAVQNANEIISSNASVSYDDITKRLRDNWRRLED